MRIVHSGTVGAGLFAIRCRSYRAGRNDGIDTAITRRRTVAASGTSTTHSASWSSATHSAGSAGVVLETGIGVRESAGTRRIATVKRGIAT